MKIKKGARIMKQKMKSQKWGEYNEWKPYISSLLISILVVVLLGLCLSCISVYCTNKNYIVTGEQFVLEEANRESELATTAFKLEPVKLNYYEITESERTYIENIVAGESGGEPLEGKMAVAQCILNAMKKHNYSPEEVKRYYQYAGWNENLKTKNPKAYEEVQLAVHKVFDLGEKVTEEEILYFYAPKICSSKWHESQKFVIEINNHRFFALNG